MGKTGGLQDLREKPGFLFYHTLSLRPIPELQPLQEGWVRQRRVVQFSVSAISALVGSISP